MNARPIPRSLVATSNANGTTRRTGRLPADVLRVVVRDETFPERLRRLRKAAGLSQSELARQAGVHYGTVWACEQKHDASAGTVRLIADALGTSMDYLFSGRGEP